MPTGYTAGIEDGTIKTAEEFLLKCARAFGACVDMRDEPLSKPIQRFEPSDYHKNALEKAKNNYEKYHAMSIEEAEIEVRIAHNKKVSDAKKYLAEKIKINKRYAEILSKVKQWQPPTDEHKDLKRFAIEQIEMCIDNNISYYERMITSVMQSGQEWLTSNLEQSLKDIEYHTNEWEKEIERCNSRNLWVDLLRESLV